MKNEFEIIAQIDEALLAQKSDLTPREHTLARMVKIAEEFGEVANAVNHVFGFQRTTKELNDPLSELKHEIGDLFLACGLLGIQLSRIYNFPLRESVNARLVEKLNELTTRRDS